MSIEIFKRFPLSPSVKVGNLGTIIKPCGKPARQSRHSLGYLAVGIKIDGKIKTFKAHRVIALTWCDNPENKATVNHINGIKDDNRAVNLEWLTLSENHKHAWHTGLQSKEKHSKARKGFKHSEETKAKLSASKQGKKRIGKGGKWIDAAQAQLYTELLKQSGVIS